mmetsp:Transcript_14179/g.47321  ORF Transcript_14179/g.47321 Transcript_14179/m.47321 type:complete len:216 (-) Transcript_14179:173-820(-)
MALRAQAAADDEGVARGPRGGAGVCARLRHEIRRRPPAAVLRRRLPRGGGVCAAAVEDAARVPPLAAPLGHSGLLPRRPRRRHVPGLCAAVLRPLGRRRLRVGRLLARRRARRDDVPVRRRAALPLRRRRGRRPRPGLLDARRARAAARRGHRRPRGAPHAHVRARGGFGVKRLVFGRWPARGLVERARRLTSWSQAARGPRAHRVDAAAAGAGL